MSIAGLVDHPSNGYFDGSSPIEYDESRRRSSRTDFLVRASFEIFRLAPAVLVHPGENL